MLEQRSVWYQSKSSVWFSEGYDQEQFQHIDSCHKPEFIKHGGVEFLFFYTVLGHSDLELGYIS